MNAENRTVLGILRELTGGDDVFKVIEADEILAKLPEGAEAMTKQQLGVAIRELRDAEYVKVKYFTPDEYCLKTETKELPEEAPAVVVAEAVAEEESKALAEVQPENLPAVRERKKAQKESRTSGVTGKAVPLFFGMIGAMIGGGIVTAIALILQKVLFM